MDRIEGGYFIKARRIAGSEISSAPPCTRETWDFLLREANHQDRRVNGRIIRRGQLVRSVGDIRDALAWKVGYRVEKYPMSACENSMKWLRSRGMIATTKTGRGIIITVCNYDYYQSQKNYESRTESRTESRDESRSDAEVMPNEKQALNELEQETKNKNLSFTNPEDGNREGGKPPGKRVVVGKLKKCLKERCSGMLQAHWDKCPECGRSQKELAREYGPPGGSNENLARLVENFQTPDRFGTARQPCGAAKWGREAERAVLRAWNERK